MSEIDLSSPERQALLEKRVRWKLDACVLLPVTLVIIFRPTLQCAVADSSSLYV
ncbi:hypothetical protein M378DRAFT_160716 [Amanita muscaria Koide BX008]|uniref:Uncharacterized protein n=1 Tax=Amanita muscaria (strain Koide BX008) TaxID=946122 RepID=A0A0C2XBG2_AMAMK|nr:hypothetical protein M378DRAFT_160716 [Amanita muscaria Koide BX008]